MTHRTRTTAPAILVELAEGFRSEAASWRGAAWAIVIVAALAWRFAG